TRKSPGPCPGIARHAPVPPDAHSLPAFSPTAGTGPYWPHHPPVAPLPLHAPGHRPPAESHRATRAVEYEPKCVQCNPDRSSSLHFLLDPLPHARESILTACEVPLPRAGI